MSAKGNRWLASQRAAHTRALASPQAFPLLGDGDHVATLCFSIDDKITGTGELTGAALAEARYRDWLEYRATGQEPERRVHSGQAEGFTLAPERDDPPARVNRTTVSCPERLASAELVIHGLVAEFGDWKTYERIQNALRYKLRTAHLTLR